MKNRRAGALAWFVAACTGFSLWVLVGAPTLDVFLTAFTDEAGQLSGKHLASFRDLIQPTLVTMGIVTASVALAALTGLPLAIAIATSDFRGRRLLGALLMLPMTLPPLVGALAIRSLVNELGMIPNLLRAAGFVDAPHLDGWAGVLAVHALTMYPIVYAFSLAALARIDASQFEASRVHGASMLSTFFRVMLPALRPALAASCPLVAMTSLASFTAPLYFKPGGAYLTLVVFQTRETDPSRSILGTLILAALALLVLLGFTFIEGKTAPPISRGAPRPLTSMGGRWQRRIIALGLALFTCVALLPQVAIFVLALADGWRYNEPIPLHYTTRHVTALFTQADMAAPLVNSLMLAGVSVVGALTLGCAAAWWRRRLRIPGKPIVEALCMIPFALPGTVLGLAMLRHFNVPTLGGLVPAIAGSAVLMPLAYMVRTLPLTYRAASAGLLSCDPSTEEAAATLGASPWRRMLRVILPALLPALSAAALLAFLTAAGEFPASILLHIPENEPVSVRINTLARESTTGKTFAYAAALIALQVVIVAAAAWLSRRRPRVETRGQTG